jgi:hypothetical protein
MTKVIQYEIYLPLQYNDGTWIEDEKYDHVHQRLFDRFSGVTHIRDGSTTYEATSAILSVWRTDAG